MRLEHGNRLTSLLGSAEGVCARFLRGSDGRDRRRDVLDNFGPGDVLVSTLIREGVDLPELDAVVLAGGRKARVDVIQQIGRALRPEGRETAVVVDVRDRGEYLGEHFDARREIVTDYYAEFVPELDRDPAVKAVREWLARNGVSTDEVTIAADPDGGVRLEITGWIDDLDHYIGLMQSAGAEWDGEANYICETERLPEVA